MRLFILGTTGSGKSYLADQLARALQLPVLEGSSWIRRLTGVWEHGPVYSQALAEASQALLAMDPERSLKELRRHDPGQCIFVGLRNPVDYFGLVTPLSITIRMVGEPTTDFEREGLAKIFKDREPDLTLTAYQYQLDEVLVYLRARHEVLDVLRQRSAVGARIE